MSRGDHLTRMGPERYSAASAAAAAAGMSLNAFVCKAVDAAIEGGGMSSSAARDLALAEIGDVASRLRQGFLLVPADETGTSHWDHLMKGHEK